MSLEYPENIGSASNIHQPESSADPSLTFVTWNVGMLFIKRLSYVIIEPAPYKHMRLQYLPAALNSCPANIIALQELYDPHDVAFVLHQTRDRYPYYAVAEYKHHGSHLNPGLIILSDKPILQSKFHPFKIVPPDEAFFIRKGMLHCTIDAGVFGKLEIVNTHNTSGGVLWQPHDWLMHKVRKLQYGQMFKFLDNYKNSQRILLGDFNSSPEATMQSYSALTRPDFHDAWSLHYGPELHKRKPTWDSSNPLNIDGPHSKDEPESMDHFHLDVNFLQSIAINHLDTIFTEHIVRGPNDQRVTISDHYGLELRLGLKRQQATAF